MEDPAAREAKRRWDQAYYARHREKTRARTRATKLRTKFGITPDDYVHMLATQGGRCALCPATKNTQTGGRLCVDHDHTTGRVRGLLCRTCNVMLGYIERDVPAFAAPRVLAYLARTAR